MDQLGLDESVFASLALGLLGGGTDTEQFTSVLILQDSTLESLINREKLIAVHNMEHPQKVNSQEANNCLFLDIFYLF